MNARVLAVIPARANSKRIPGKNKKLFLGKPLITWTIEAALASEFVTDVVVTTDDDEILAFQTTYTKVKFVKRPDHLALDETPGVDPILDLMKKSDQEYDYVILLQPTSPLRNSVHMARAFEALLQSGKKQIVSVKKISDPLGYVVFKEGSGIQFLKKNLSHALSDNDLKVLNGAIYISEWHTLLNEKTFIGQDVEFFEMDEAVSVDIDYPEDWKKAERYASTKE